MIENKQTALDIVVQLKNNSKESLEGALKRLGKRSTGDKEELLMRLALALSTPQGKEMARLTFPSSLWRKIYNES